MNRIILYLTIASAALLLVSSCGIFDQNPETGGRIQSLVVTKVADGNSGSSSLKLSSTRYVTNPSDVPGCSGVISFVIKGGRETAMKFMDSLKLASNEVHVADIRTCVLHPASETHRQLTDEQLVAAGIEGGMIRLSVGLEDIDDIMADLEQGFAAARG